MKELKNYEKIVSIDKQLENLRLERESILKEMEQKIDRKELIKLLCSKDYDYEDDVFSFNFDVDEDENLIFSYSTDVEDPSPISIPPYVLKKAKSFKTVIFHFIEIEKAKQEMIEEKSLLEEKKERYSLFLELSKEFGDSDKVVNITKKKRNKNER